MSSVTYDPQRVNWVNSEKNVYSKVYTNLHN